MTSADSLYLIRRAKEGDPEARRAIVERYYPRWIERVRGRVGPRRLYDTVDVVQSAIAQALENLDTLRNDGAFFAWVSTIIEHKRAEKWRRRDARPRLSLDDLLDGVASDARIQGEEVGSVDVIDDAIDVRAQYERVLDGIESLFRPYPEAMAALTLRHIEGLDIAAVVKALGRSERSVFRLLDEGRRLLRSKLEPI